jgi:TIR domain
MEPLKVFISYGRGDASAFVDRLSRDLREAGFEVWRDTSDIRPGVAWDAEVAAAIKSSDLLVAVLTPHAVRGGSIPVSLSEASVCIDELQAARFDKPPTPIVPIMLIPCEAPFIIARLHWIDFQGAENDSARYEAAFARLAQTIREVKTGQLIAFRAICVEPLDFDLYLKEKGRDFVGREWLVGEVSDRLADPETNVVLLVGEPGWGKTAFASHIYRNDPDGRLLAAHFCRADRTDTISPRRFVESVAALIGLRIPTFAERLSARLAAEPDLLGKDAEVSFERMVLEPLGALDPASLGPLPRYLLVDALDESVTPKGEGLHRLLAQASRLLPDWLKVVATTRDAFGIVETFHSATVIRLERADPRNRADVRLLIRQRLKPAGGVGSEDLSFLDLGTAIEAKAAGNALVAAQLAVAARKSGLAAEAVRTLPQGLSALYRVLLERRFDPRRPEWATVREILAMIMTTDAPVPLPLLASALGDEDQYKTREAVEDISDLLARQEDAIQLFHQTFREFLEQRTHPFFVNPRAGASRLAVVAAAPAPPRALQDFGANRGHVLKLWIAESENPAQHVGLLQEIYPQEFAREFRLYETPVDAESLPDDMRLVAALVRADRIDALVSIIELAFRTADGRVRAALAGGTLQNPPQRSAGEFAGYFQPAMWLANFGLIWIREIARLAPAAKSRLREALRDADVFTFFNFFGPALGCKHYNMSSYYEIEADHLSAEYNRIYEELGRPWPMRLL